MLTVELLHQAIRLTSSSRYMLLYFLVQAIKKDRQSFDCNNVLWETNKSKGFICSVCLPMQTEYENIQSTTCTLPHCTIVSSFKSYMEIGHINIIGKKESCFLVKTNKLKTYQKTILMHAL